MLTRIVVTVILGGFLVGVASHAFVNIAHPANPANNVFQSCHTLNTIKEPTKEQSDACQAALGALSWPFAEFGLVAVLTLLLVTYAFSGQHPLALFASDGSTGLSISKFQFFAWTVVVGYVYAMLYAARLAATGNPGPITSIPYNVLLAMGFSITTAIAAKAITVNYLGSGRLTQQASGQTNLSPASLITSDDAPDLNKVQMLFWTIVATSIFVIQGHSGIYAAVVCDVTNPANTCFPSIDTSLMLLMGLSQASYLGGKLTSVNTPTLQSISPAVAKAATLATTSTQITIVGSNFGAQQSGSLVLINDAPLWGGPIQTWSDAKIVFSIPPKQLDNTDWSPGSSISVNVQVGGVKATAQNLSLT
jgi:hypothetical protein